MPQPPPPLLEVRDLVLHYTAEGRLVRAVDGVSFAIADRGEALGVVGESGSGKSSLANAVMRLLPKNVAAFSGSIKLQGEELTTLSDERFRREVRWSRIAMVFQGAMNVLNPVLRIGDQIAEPMLLPDRLDKAAANRRAEDLLERVGLGAAMARRYPHELSGGQKQRAVIATALALDPDLLILDEPTSALDVSVQAQIMNVLKDLKADPGIAMLFITHDIGLASDLCDRIAVAYAGEHAEIGPAARILRAPRHPYTRGLLASLPSLRADAPPRSMPGDPPDPANLPHGCRFHPRCRWRFARCDDHPPPLPLSDGGHARCWLVDEPGRDQPLPAAADTAIPAAMVAVLDHAAGERARNAADDQAGEGAGNAADHAAVAAAGNAAVATSGDIAGTASGGATGEAKDDDAVAEAVAAPDGAAGEATGAVPRVGAGEAAATRSRHEIDPAEPLVRLDDVAVAFSTRAGLFRSGEVRAVDGVTLAVAPGETLTLVGESGSGKTTLGRVALRLLKPTAGRVWFAGRDISAVSDESLGWLRKRAQIVFQDPFSSLNPAMRVGELVEEPLLIDGVKGDERRARALAALAAVDLSPPARWADRYPTALSGGQRQRVGIARALVRDPEFIVADEPVSMIDASSRIEILTLLRRLQQERGVAFLAITHDLASARHFSDRIAVLLRGRVVEDGPSAAVIDHPAHPYTRALVAAVPEPDPANLHRRRAVGGWDDGDGRVLHPACRHAADLAARPELLPLDGGEAGHRVACHLPPDGVEESRSREGDERRETRDEES
jgi:oligopeptide/dipeptide ABC transporter ATP-binding protein